MPFFWKKQENVEKMMADYFDTCDACFQLFEKAFGTYWDNGQGESFAAAVDRAHELEAAADDLRRDIELTLYGKALLPESRGDLLGLLETYDKVPNMAETVLFSLKCQQIAIPAPLAEDFRKLIAVNLQAYFLLRKAVDELMNNPRATLHTTREVIDKEIESDDVERSIICRLFSPEMQNLDSGLRLVLKDLLLLIGKISDRAEAVADRIAIISIKRQI
jgi:uncharacterized protein